MGRLLSFHSSRRQQSLHQVFSSSQVGNMMIPGRWHLRSSSKKIPRWPIKFGKEFSCNQRLYSATRSSCEMS